MTSSQAMREFQIRYYWWSKSEFEREIEQSFENFRSSKILPVLELQQFMEKLDKTDQMLLANALLKRFHPDALDALNEGCTPEEVSIRNRLDNFRHDCWVSQFQVPEQKPSGERLKRPTKRKLLRSTAEKFHNAFPKSMESNREEDYDPGVEFQTKTDGWIIFTRFWFGRREPVISYCHGICTERIFEQKGAAGNMFEAQFSLASLISFCSWLGISSQTEWECRSMEDVPVACEELIKHCQRFFEVAPRLLKGIEIDRIGGV